MSRILVTGFGPFPGTPRNPTATLARAVDGAQVGAYTVRGLVLPVSWRRGPDLAISTARELGASLVIGLGVAGGRSAVCVERTALRVDEGMRDVDGQIASCLEGPDRIEATVDTDRLAAALGAELSDDAGRYVCNAWLYRVAQALDVPVGFVHVPAVGLASERLLAAIRELAPADAAAP